MEKTNGKIYKVINTKDDFIYIGSTTVKLSSRMGSHRANAKNIIKKSKLYEHMRKIGIEYFKILLIKDFVSDSREALETEEYNIMATFDKNILLNENIVYKKHTDEHNRKVGEAQKGEKHINWKFGSVLKTKKTDKIGGWITESWCYRYILDGKYRSFSFSIKKHGEEEAKKLAESKRLEIFPNAV